jgi:hypothetical protein
MKHLKTPFIGLAILCTILSCQKDVQQQNSPEDNPSVAIEKTIIESDWSKNLSWSKVELPSHTVFYTNIKTSISAETESQGLVRVFKSSHSSATQSLPLEEVVNGKNFYWYYQATEGNLMISVDVYGSAENPATTAAFKSVVLTRGAVTNFETKGNTRTSIMTMPLEELTSNQ